MWTKVWEWIKKWWKWILFPIGILGVVAAYLAGRAKAEVVAPPDLGNAGLDAVGAVIETDRLRNERLEALRKEHVERLRDLTEDETKELEELRQKPLDDVVSWFNNLR